MWLGSRKFFEKFKVGVSKGKLLAQGKKGEFTNGNKELQKL